MLRCWTETKPQHKSIKTTFNVKLSQQVKVKWHVSAQRPHVSEWHADKRPHNNRSPAVHLLGLCGGKHLHCRARPTDTTPHNTTQTQHKKGMAKNKMDAQKYIWQKKKKKSVLVVVDRHGPMLACRRLSLHSFLFWEQRHVSISGLLRHVVHIAK